jgi:hypothetical protein
MVAAETTSHVHGTWRHHGCKWASEAGPMNKSLAVIPVERVEQTIVRIRDEKVILDADLAKLYGVSTKRLNEQVKRNRERFPEDFMFQLTIEEARSNV